MSLFDVAPYRRRDLVLVLACGLLFLGVALGARDLWNPNEPTYGRVVVEMVEGGDWLVPRLHGEPFVEKPILYYWLAAAVSQLAGDVSEATLRIPVLVANLATLLLTYLLVDAYDGRRRALMAAGLFATLYVVWFTARNAQMDSFVLASTAATVYALARRIDGPWSGRRAWLAAGVAMGLGFSAKGPVAVAVPALIVGAYVLVGRRPWRRLLSGLPWGLAVGVLLASPWYLALWAAGRTDALHELLLRQNVGRFLEAWDHQQPWWYYLKYFWLTFAPWSWFVPAAAAAALRRGAAGDERAAARLLPWVWVLAPLVFFSLSESKREPYMLPAAPAVAWLAATVLEPLGRRELRPGLTRAVALIGGILGFVLLSAGALILWPGTLERAPVELFAPLPAAVTGLGGLAILVTALAPRFRARLPLAVLGAFAALFLLVAMYLHPLANAVKSHRPIAEALRSHVPVGHPLYSYFGPRWYLRGGYAFYLERSLPDLKDAAGLEAAWRDEPGVCVVTEGEELRPALRALPAAETVFEGEVGSRTVRLVCHEDPPSTAASEPGP